MATFPTLLKTGAIAQFPLARTARFVTQSVQFLDGSRQTYSLNGAGLRRWDLRLALLDEAELAAVAAFAEEIGTGTFSFTDPVSGETAAKCVISGWRVGTSLAGDLDGAATLGIEEVK
ncbi:MAG TPA: hypothetical protein VHA14_10295 [Bryobacteraceae bacterium]|nr:hypothetical protein [Bryobacteraceae bacterium]